MDITIKVFPNRYNTGGSVNVVIFGKLIDWRNLLTLDWI